MKWSDLSFEDKIIRQFAAICLLLLPLIAFWQWYVNERTLLALILLILSALVGPTGLIAPAVIRPVYQFLMLTLFPVAWFFSHLMLGCLYFLVFTPIAVIFRLVGRDPMQRQFHGTATTYWQDHQQTDHAKRYLRQY